MEFIPLERYSKKNKNKDSTQEKKSGKNKKVEESETSEDTVVKKTKSQPRVKVVEKKNVKNKYKETLALKQKKRVPKKKKKKKAEDEDDEEEEEVVEEKEGMEVDDQKEEKETEENEEDEDDDDDDDDDDGDDDDDEEENDTEKAYKRKCEKMDEKKKNRLFLKLNKKISNKNQIKQLHPDIRDVIFPRKRNTRWCWAVFASEERADEAMKQLIKNKEVLVSKPTPYDKVDKKKKEKMKTVMRKKEARKKLQKMWM